MSKALVVETARVGEPEAQEIETVPLSPGAVPLAETVSAAAQTGRPDPAWVRGRCPVCGDDLVSNLYYIGGRGYLLRWECWSSLQENPTCRYRKVL